MNFFKEVDMFELANWRNPETLWLNITNGALGIATIVLIGWIFGAAIHEFIQQHNHPHGRH